MVKKKQARTCPKSGKRRDSRACESYVRSSWCVTDAIFCDQCREWVDYAFENICEGEFKSVIKCFMSVRLL